MRTLNLPLIMLTPTTWLMPFTSLKMMNLWNNYLWYWQNLWSYIILLCRPHSDTSIFCSGLADIDLPIWPGLPHLWYHGISVAYIYPSWTMTFYMYDCNPCLIAMFCVFLIVCCSLCTFYQITHVFHTYYVFHPPIALRKVSSWYYGVM